VWEGEGVITYGRKLIRATDSQKSTPGTIVTDPDNSSQSLYEAWTSFATSPLIGRLGGGGSDYKPFVQHVKISSIDIAFGEDTTDYPVYHSFVWGLVALWLAGEEFLPFDYQSYAKELQNVVTEFDMAI
ncbi:hypothetical protein HN51_004647, partial [Arachis hypogaea]